jgi:membrane-associated phospholipid phosphatase
MKPIDYLIQLAMSVFLIFGVYQFYFWCQRQSLRPVIRFDSKLDEALPFWPVWAWVYSFLYYPAIVYLNWVVLSPRHYNHLAMSFFILLFMQMAFFLLFPVATPTHWRAYAEGPGWSKRFLRFVQKFDAPTNCFPSMHVSVATLTALHAKAHLGPSAFAFPALIAISCVFSKQHYLIDLPFGAALGWIAWLAFQQMGGATG